MEAEQVIEKILGDANAEAEKIQQQAREKVAAEARQLKQIVGCGAQEIYQRLSFPAVNLRFIERPMNY